MPPLTFMKIVDSGSIMTYSIHYLNLIIYYTD